MAYRYYPLERMKRLSEAVFLSYGYSAEESAFITDVILAADRAGIESHGVNRLDLYPHGIDIGRIKLHAETTVEFETPISAVLDAHDGDGHLPSKLAMEMAIQKAKTCGIGMVAVRNSNHFGIAGFYSRMALKEGLMGICMTNAEGLVVPTFGKQPMLGTNPIAVSMPAEPIPFHLDMATSVVPGGKLEVYAKNDQEVPHEWIVDSTGHDCTNPHEFNRIRFSKDDGGLLPLGGFGEKHSGHKGFGLALVVELMTANFAHGNNGDRVRCVPDQEKTCHFFAALDLNAFGDRDDIIRSFSDYLQRIRDSRKANGHDRIYIHGEKELESEQRVEAEGIRVNEPTLREIEALCARRGLNIHDFLEYKLDSE